MGEQELMDCEHIREALDAYALGAASGEETDHIERHVADCLGCWEELTKSQQTAALLALSVPMNAAPERLERRIMSQAEREKVGVREERKQGFFQRFRFTWPAAAGAFGAVSLAAIVFSGALQMQVDDLQGENSQLRSELRSSTFALERQLDQTDSLLQEQQTLFTVLSDSQAQEIQASPPGEDFTASASYSWSPDSQKGFVRCTGLPALAPGKVYQVWVTAEGGAYPMAAFRTADGTCQILLDTSSLEEPRGLGLSVEQSPGGIDRPQGGWLLYAHFPDEAAEAAPGPE